MDGAQPHVLTFLGETWGMGSPRFTTEQVLAWSRKIADAGSVITLDVPIQKSGDAEQGSLCHRLAQFLVGHIGFSPTF